MWINIPKYGHIPGNVDTMSKNFGQNHTKVDRILENNTFGLSKSKIGYSVASATIVSIFLVSTAHNWARHKSIIDSPCLVSPTTLLRYWRSYL